MQAAIPYLKTLSTERFLEIYAGLEVQGFGPLDREVAQSLKFRPQAIQKLPMAQRAKRAHDRRASGQRRVGLRANGRVFAAPQEGPRDRFS